ncbi:4Fe-4S dicluster domain-containing protein [Verrucomicrobiales bacterium]|nr:4Fe-4S dicluster domain-containing protein [Verrucomicrobiales bacterium]
MPMPELPAIPWEKVGPEHRLDYKRAFMLIDLNRCTGCHSCSVSCKTEHEVPLGDFRMRVRYLERPDKATLSFLPLVCMQCQDAPCLNACPTEAIGRLEDGRVVIDDEKCCGNKACVSACPYGAIFINDESNKAEKCDFCTHRTELGLEPACVSSCPTDAIRFGDLENPDDPVTIVAKAKNAKAFKEDAGTEPSVLYVDHEAWMEPKSNLGVQLSPADEDVIYEQNNLKPKV